MEQQNERKMDLRNKFQAFVLIPVIIIVLASIIYFIFTLGQIKIECLIAIIIASLFVCWIYNPVFNKNEYREMFYDDADMPIKDKIMKYRPTLAGYGGITLVIAFYALIMHY
ncbi:hypothetical protein MKZ19_16810 [Shouchella clausii]|uniref:hypothetical protein n=1 Tax=Shouchella clausii TaxID=79880 RepID=UPI000BA767AA|nr:hypothetical protein [Shouchella clausii]MCM3549962.1 hypothetical protein [Shouchella clausii]PAD45560.1 hypothetical protein CHI09_16575 [Shouchella clausii]PAF07820.1 hypothetical protein CHH65_19085 [Shouchella clausii]